MNNFATKILLLVLTGWQMGSANAETVSWADTTGFWDVATNWDLGVPAAVDDALINVTGTRTVTVRATGGPFAVKSITMTGDETLAITGNTLAVSAASTLNRLTQSGGTLDGIGTVTVTGAATLSNGVQSGAGTTLLQGMTALGGLDFDAGRVLRNEGTATLTNAFNLNATNTVGSGRIENAFSAIFDVRTFNLTTHARNFIGDTGVDAEFKNAGTLRKSTAGSYGIAVRVENTGTVDVQLGRFNFSAGGTNSGAAVLAAGASLNYSAGTHDVVSGASFTGAGTWLVNGSALVNVNAPLEVQSAFNQGGGTVQGDQLTLRGPATLASGIQTGPGTTVLTGATSLVSTDFDNGRVLRNEGTLTLTGGVNLNSVANGGSGQIFNAPGAVFDIKTFNTSLFASSFAGDTGLDAIFTNDGTLRRSSNGSYTFSVRTLNEGTIDLQIGNLSLSKGGTNSGAATLATGTTLGYGGGTHDVDAGATYTGDGTWRISGVATVVNVNAPTTVASRFDQNAGLVQGSGGLTLAGPTTLALSTFGGMTGAATTKLTGNTSIVGFNLDNGRILRNEGTVIVTGGIDLNLQNNGASGRIDNAATAVFDIRTFNLGIGATNFGATDNGLDAVLNNAGTLRRSTVGNNYSIGVQVNNTGAIDLLKGGLIFSRSSANSGSNALALGTTLGLAGGTHSIASGAIFTGLGTVALSGAGTIMQLDGPVSIASGFSMTGGTVQGGDLELLGNATLSISSSLGVMAGPGSTTLKSTSLWSGGPNNTFGLDGGRILRNEGSATITGVIDMNRLNTPGQGSGRIDNAASGVIDIQTFNQGIFATNWSDLDNGRDAVFNNAGLLKKASRLNYTISVHFNNTGTVSVENGTLTFASASGNLGVFSVANNGSLIVSAGLFVNQGTLKGNGNFVPAAGTALVNAGTLAPGFSAGALTVDGDYEQTAAGAYEVELASLASFDTLDVKGNVKLDGALRLLSLGGYTPTIGDTFTIATFDDGVADTSDLAGVFANLEWAGFSPGIGFTASYLEHSVVLNVIASPVPLPAAVWLFAPGIFALFGAGVRRTS